jgi:glycosyltransferase involved in cell wall biosynthesis
MSQSKLKIAYLSPVNPAQSGISDYSEELLPYLSRYARIDLYLDDGLKPTNPSLSRDFQVFPASRFKRNAAGYDTCLYHMGNSAHHAYIYRALLEHGKQGVLVLHDFVLHHFLIGQYLNNGRAQEYIKQMARRYGPDGENIARDVIKGKLAEALFSYPLCEEALEAAGAVLVHSRYARALIEKQYPGKPVGVARMGVPLPHLLNRQTARQSLNLPPDEFILVSLGHLNPYKRLDSALWAFRAFSREYPNSRFVLVGSPSPNYNVKAMIKALGLENRVYLAGYASDEQRAAYLAASDVCINLRYPTAGETSASLLRIMGAGRPVLVSRTGAFEELPDDTCIKVDVDDTEEELLLEYLRLLARRPELAAQLGHNARRYVAEQGRLEDAAHDYYLFLCRMLNRSPEIAAPPAKPYHPEKPEEIVPHYSVKAAEPEESFPRHDLLEEVAQAAAELELSPDSPALQKVAEVLRDLE